MNKSDISCSKIIPFTGLLTPSTLLNSIHKSAKLEIPEISDHRRSLGNIFNRLGIDNIQSVILNSPKLNTTVLSEVANNFFTSNFPKKAEELIRTMSMPSYSFDTTKENSPSITNQSTSNKVEINPIQQEIIDQIKARENIATPSISQPKKDQGPSQEQGFNSFF